MSTVLLVDDEETFLKSLVATFSRSPLLDGCRFLTARNGREALERLQKHTIDAVVTDLKMPEMDGFELIGHMGRSYREVPIVVMTAFGTEEIEQRVLDNGALFYIEKPIDPDELARLIREAISRSAKGFVSGLMLADLIQVVHLSQKSCSLLVRSGERLGRLYFWQGELVDAETDTQKGTEAALSIVTWPDPEVEIEANVKRKQKRVDLPVTNLLLEAARLHDEASRDDWDDVLGALVVPPEDDGGTLDNHEHRKEVESMATQAQIEAILQRMDGIDGAHGAMLVNRDGMVVASRVDKRYAVDKVAALSTAAVQTATKVITEAGFGKPDQMLIEGTNGKLCLIHSAKGGFFLVLIGDKDLNLGMARLALDEAIQEFDKL